MSSNTFQFTAEHLSPIPDASDMRFGIVVSEWNNDITGALLQDAIKTLTQHGAKETNIKVMSVPGSFELVFGAAQLIKSGLVDAVIAIGTVVQGDTPHFDYICEGVTQGLAQLNTSCNVPVIYGVLTVNTQQQAIDRTNGVVGYKGEEFAITAIKMVDFAWQLQK